MPPLTSLSPDWYSLGTSPKWRTDRSRLGDPVRIIDRGLERDGNQRADAGSTRQPPANVVIARNPKHLAMQLLELAPKAQPSPPTSRS
jgi:hypothetical protein